MAEANIPTVTINGIGDKLHLQSVRAGSEIVKLISFTLGNFHAHEMRAGARTMRQSDFPISGIGGRCGCSVQTPESQVQSLMRPRDPTGTMSHLAPEFFIPRHRAPPCSTSWQSGLLLLFSSDAAVPAGRQHPRRVTVIITRRAFGSFNIPTLSQ